MYLLIILSCNFASHFFYSLNDPVVMYGYASRKHAYNFDTFKPHFYIAKDGV